MLKKGVSCFDRLGTNGKGALIAIPNPFALSSSTGERRGFPHPARGAPGHRQNELHQTSAVSSVRDLSILADPCSNSFHRTYQFWQILVVIPSTGRVIFCRPLLRPLIIPPANCQFCHRTCQFWQTFVVVPPTGPVNFGRAVRDDEPRMPRRAEKSRVRSSRHGLCSKHGQIARRVTWHP